MVVKEKSEGYKSEVRYLKPSYRGKQKIIFEQKSRSDMTQPYEIQLHDARKLPSKSPQEEIKDHGFTLVKNWSPSADAAKIINPPVYRDNKSLPEPIESETERKLYFKEVQDRVKELTGADVAFTLTHTVRNQDEISYKGKEKSVQYLVQYASFVHCDFTEEILDTSWKMLEKRGVPEDVAKKMKVAFFGFWQPTKNPVEMFPLALCDARSVDPADGVSTTLGYSITPKGEEKYQPPISIPTYNPEHKWYFYPNMTPNEALLFPHCDPRDGYPLQTYHCAVKHDTKPDPVVRSSIETRVICGWLDHDEKSKL